MKHNLYLIYGSSQPRSLTILAFAYTDKKKAPRL